MKKMIIFFPLLVISVILSGCGLPIFHRGGYGHPMMDFSYGGGFMWIVILILIVLLIYYILRTSQTKDSRDLRSETPLDILKKRYAKGEITREEFEMMKKDIES